MSTISLLEVGSEVCVPFSRLYLVAPGTMAVDLGLEAGDRRGPDASPEIIEVHASVLVQTRPRRDDQPDPVLDDLVNHDVRVTSAGTNHDVLVGTVPKDGIQGRSVGWKDSASRSIRCVSTIAPARRMPTSSFAASASSGQPSGGRQERHLVRDSLALWTGNAPIAICIPFHPEA